jgi:hypothetical protein
VSWLTRKSIQEINFSYNQDCQRKAAAYKKRMPIARCACGFEILVLPDLRAMNRAIKNHMTEHKQAGNGRERLSAFHSLTEFLTEQVLIVASKMNLSNLN